jgi:hypothetical protein
MMEEGGSWKKVGSSKLEEGGTRRGIRKYPISNNEYPIFNIQ